MTNRITHAIEALTEDEAANVRWNYALAGDALHRSLLSDFNMACWYAWGRLDATPSTPTQQQTLDAADHVETWGQTYALLRLDYMAGRTRGFLPSMKDAYDAFMNGARTADALCNPRP